MEVSTFINVSTSKSIEFKTLLFTMILSTLAHQVFAQVAQTWISDYVLLDDNASQGVKAKFPLREARIDVLEVPGKPGVYTATAFLRPHFQLEELSASIRLVAELPPPSS